MHLQQFRTAVTHQLAQARIHFEDFIGGVAHVDGIVGMLKDDAEAGFTFSQRLRGPLMLSTQTLLFEGMRHRLAQTCHPVFQQIIGGALLHALDGNLFADAAGDDNERDIETALLQQLQGAQRAKLWQAVIGQNQVEGRIKRRNVVGFRLDAPPVGGEAGSPQLMQYELGISGAIFQNQ